MQSESTIVNICKTWLESSHVPAFLKVKNAEGTTTMYSFNLIYEYVIRNFEAKFNESNLNTALARLIKSGRIPAHSKMKQDPQTLLWHNPPNVAVEEEKQHQRELAHMGIVKDNRSHAEEKPKTTNTLADTFKKVIGQINQTQAYVPKTASKETLRTIPDDATKEQLKQYSAAEIKAFLHRRREKERLEQSPY
jgi:hypothetical protein